MKQESTARFPAQGSFPDAGVPRVASRALYTVSLLGWLTMEAEMHLMVNKDRLLVWIFASHFAKEFRPWPIKRKPESNSSTLFPFGYAVDGGPVQVIDLARGETIPEEILDVLTDDTVTKWAFNANFERVCLSRYLTDLGRSLDHFLKSII